MPKKRFASSTTVRLLAMTAICIIFVERPLSAYADPGSGLLMWQLLGAVVIGAGFQLRRVITKLKSLTAREAVPEPSSSVTSRETGTQENGHGIVLS